MANPAFHRDGSAARYQDADADPCANEYARAHSHRDPASDEHANSSADAHSNPGSDIHRDASTYVHGYAGADQYRNSDPDQHPNADTNGDGNAGSNEYTDAYTYEYGHSGADVHSYSRAHSDPNAGAYCHGYASRAHSDSRTNTHRRWRKNMVGGLILLLLLAGAVWAQENGPSEGVVIVPPQNTPVGTGTAGTLSAATAIAALPTCTAGNAGRFAQIDDQQNTPVWAQTPVATASAGVKAGVYCNGSSWTIFCK